MSLVKKIKILNLTGELSGPLTDYFSEDKFQIIGRGALDNYESMDYILVVSLAQAKEASQDFSVEKNDIKIVCLGEIQEMKDFLLSNGRLVIEKSMVENKLGKSILNKFFFGEHNIHLAGSFSEIFNQTSEFVLTTHLSAGASIDRVSFDAFEKGFNLVSLRSFLDHSIYYLAYLRQAGLAGIPFEFEYGSSDEFFAINIQTTVKNFVAEYILDSFGEVNSRDPLSFLLGVMNRSCDYLDMTLMEDPSKIVFTAVWSKNRELAFSGSAFHNILTTQQVIAQVERQLENFVPQEEQITAQQQKLNELKDKKLPGDIAELKTSLEINSVLNEEPQQMEQIINFTVETIDMAMPDTSLVNVTIEQFDEILAKHPDQEFISQLSDQDKEHLLENVQKKEMLDAYQLEMDQVKESLPMEEIQAEVQDSLADDLSSQLLGSVDLSLLEGMMIEGSEQAAPAVPGVDAAGNTLATTDLNDPFANVAAITAEQMPGMPQANQAAPGALDDAFNVGALDQMNGLNPVANPGMPVMDTGDPFATGDFNPAMPQMPVMPDVAPVPAQIDMATGQPVPIQMDPATGAPAEVQINPQTGNPVEVQVDNQTGEPVQIMMNPQAGVPVQVDPNTGQQIPVQVNPETGEIALIPQPVAPMPMQGADPFATEGFNPQAAAAPAPAQPQQLTQEQVQAQMAAVPQAAEIPAEKLPEGIQEMVNPATGQPMHVMIDEATGMPVPVKVNAETLEVTPIKLPPPPAPPAESFAMPGVPTLDEVKPIEAPPLVNTQELDTLGGLPTMPDMQMPGIDTGDPFATEEFNPAAQVQLPPGVQTMVNPTTGEAVHIMMDPQTGMPTPVTIDPETNQAVPIVQAAASVVNEATTIEQAAAPVVNEAATVKQAPQVNPKTGQPIMTMVDPNTGNEIHMSMDPATGQPVQVDPVSGEPFQVSVNQTVNQAPGQNVQNITIQQMNIQDTQANAEGGFSGGVEETYSQTVSGGEEEDDFSQTVAGLPEDMDLDQFISGMDEEPEPTLIIGGDPDDPDDFVQILKGGEEEADDFVQTIEGMGKQDDLVTIISDNIMNSDDKTEFVIKGDPRKAIENMVVKNLGGNDKLNGMDPAVKGFMRENAPSEIEKGLIEYARSLGVNPDDLTPEQLKDFQQNHMPKIMQRMLNDQTKVKEFSQKIAGAPTQTAEDLKKDERVVKAMQQQNEKLKQIIKDKEQQAQPANLLNVKDGPRDVTPQEFEDKFKKKFQDKMKAMQEKMNGMQKELGQAKADAKKAANASPESKQQQMQKVLQETVKESFSDAFTNKNMSAQEKAAKEKEIVKGLATTLKMPEEEVKAIVKDVNKKAEEKEKEIVKERMQGAYQPKSVGDDPEGSQAKDGASYKQAAASNTAAQNALMSKLKKIELENKRLKDGMKAMKLNDEAKKAVKEKVDSAKEQTKVSDKEVDEAPSDESTKIVVPEPAVKIDDKERESILEKVKNGEKLTEEEQQKVSSIMNSGEQSVQEVAKQAERNLKKLKLESEKKDVVFQMELDKATKAVKAKEMVLEKAKETMKTAVTKKQQEIEQLKNKVVGLNQKLDGNESATLGVEVKELKKENESLAKMSELYKSKLESMAKKVSESKSEDNSAALAEENKNLKRIKESLEKKMADVDKQYKKMEQEYQGVTSDENTIKSELSKYKGEVKKQEGLINTLKDQQKLMIEKMKKAQENKEQMTEREISKYKETQAKMHKQLKEAQTKLRDATANAKNVDEKQIEANIAKKYSAQVQQAQKEMAVAKNQSMQLQAKIKELTAKLSGGGAGADGKGAGGSPKEKKLEQDVKKLNTEITKVRNAAANQKKEVMTAQKEATGLKNQLAAMKKELEKAKKAAAAAAAGKGKKAA